MLVKQDIERQMVTKTKTRISADASPEIEAQAVTALPVADSVDVAITAALCRLLGDDEHGYAVRRCDGLSPPCAFFVTESGLAFCPVDDRCIPLIANIADLAVTCSVLDDADDMLRFVENILSVSLEPLGETIDANKLTGLCFHITGPTGAMLLAVQSDQKAAAFWTDCANAVDINDATLPVVIALSFTAAMLSIADASGIAGGDLLLLPPSAPMQFGGTALPLNGVFSIYSGTFIVTDQPITLHQGQSMTNLKDDTEDAGSTPLQRFDVPVSIRLPDQLISAATLAAMVPGSSISIGPLLQGLPIEMFIGGKRLASGEIVQIGGSFAVLVDERMSTDTHRPYSANGEAVSTESVEDE